MADIIEQLSEFGLNQIEAKIYLHLLNKNPQTILEIAKEANIPRTSVYDNTLRLIEKGLLERSIIYKSQRFRAFPLTILQAIIDKEKRKTEKLQENLNRLEKLFSKPFLPQAETQMRYYHGAQGFMQMMWNSLSAEKETIGYSEFGRVDVVGQKFMSRWFEETISRNITDRVIANPTKEIIDNITKGQEYRKKYQNTRFLDTKHLYISGDTTIYNNIFAVGYWKQGEIVGVEIENAELVKTQKSIFEELWKLAKPRPD